MHWPRVSRLARSVIETLDRIVPKSDVAVFCSVPDWDAQVLMMLESWRDDSRECVVLTVGHQQDPPHWAEVSMQGVKVVRKNSVAGFWQYLRARYVFFTHGLFLNPRPPRRKLVLNLWHGNPIKRVGLDDGPDAIHSTAALTTSPAYVPIISRAFGIREDQVWVTGLPRTDDMLRHAALGITSPVRRRIVWLPTFRDRQQGRTLDVQGIVHLDGADVQSLKDLSQDYGYEIVIKAHPYVHVGDVDVQESGLLRVLSDRSARHSEQGLGRLLASAHILITDNSSVWQDFLLLDRPIVFAVSDLHAMREGYPLSDRWVGKVGPLVTSIEGLRRVLEELEDRDDSWAAARRSARLLLHTFVDDRSSDRVVSRVEDWRSDRLRAHISD